MQKQSISVLTGDTQAGPSFDAETSPRSPRTRTKTASAPFNDISGDLILRTSNKVLFYTQSIILCLASGYFRRVVSDKSHTDLHSPAPDHPIIIDVDETSRELYPALSWCYPIPHSKAPGITVIPTVLRVAVKYDMLSVKELMHLPLQELLTAHPRRVFALACTYHFEDVAQKAAVLIKQRFVHADSWNDPWGATTASQVYPKKMPEIPSALYLRLIAFTQSDHVDPPTFCSPPHTPMPNMATITPRHITYSDADIVIRTRNGGWLEFYVHITFVMFSSRILKAEILELMDSHDIPGQLPVLELPESGTTLSVLLTLCYPSSDSDTLTVSLSDIPDLVDAGRKYEIYAVDGFCRRLIRKLERDDPFHAYSLAMKYEWHEEARVAAVRIARLNIEYQYHHCMETLEARLYYPLLEFCHEYRKRLRGISENTGYTTSFGTNGDGPTDLTQCQWLWQLEQSDMRDAAWALAVSAQTAPDGTDQLQRLQMIHTRVVEELDKLQLNLGPRADTDGSDNERIPTANLI